jgi:hypothetical protein
VLTDYTGDVMNTLKSLALVAIVSAGLMQFALIQLDKTVVGSAMATYASGSVQQIEYFLGE